MASPGSTIVLAPGTYRGGLTIPGRLHDLSIRGEDRNTVVFDGRDREANAITIAADDVVVANPTIHSFRANGLLWHDVAGYGALDVTVWNVGAYGIYAIGSRRGLVARSLVSGAGDAAFYVGECHPCHATLRDDTAMLSGIGYSGTNAGGSLLVERSLFDRNGTGILPNSYDDEANPPQREAMFRGNRVVGSGSVPTPATDPVDGLTGIGIGIAGGRLDVVHGNVVTGSARYGIAVFATIQPGDGRWSPSGNRISANRVRGSGVADLALAAGAASGNCFIGNVAGATAPADLERTHRCGGPAPAGGDAAVSAPWRSPRRRRMGGRVRILPTPRCPSLQLSPRHGRMAGHRRPPSVRRSEPRTRRSRRKGAGRSRRRKRGDDAGAGTLAAPRGGASARVDAATPAPRPHPRT
ncbi:MAG TPA: right-handed parallel beta-helix repeat-containing protein [Actinomycetota bacterium]